MKRDALSKTMRDGLRMLARDIGEWPSVSTVLALSARGLVTVTWGEVAETFRPSRSWSSVRWTRLRTTMTTVTLTDAGRKALEA